MKINEAQAALDTARATEAEAKAGLASNEVLYQEAVANGNQGAVVKLQASVAISQAALARASAAIVEAEGLLALAIGQEAERVRQEHRAAGSYDRFVAGIADDLAAIVEAERAKVRIVQAAQRAHQHIAMAGDVPWSGNLVSALVEHAVFESRPEPRDTMAHAMRIANLLSNAADFCPGFWQPRDPVAFVRNALASGSPTPLTRAKALDMAPSSEPTAAEQATRAPLNPGQIREAFHRDEAMRLHQARARQQAEDAAKPTDAERFHAAAQVSHG